MDNVTVEGLKKIHGDKAVGVFTEIATLGGFGEVGSGQGMIDAGSNLDLTGVLDPENKAVTAAAKSKIRELVGADSAKAEKGKETK
jgi:hypothetical protein